MHKQKNLMRNVYGENFEKPRNSHKQWSCEASMSFLVSKTGLYTHFVEKSNSSFAYFLILDFSDFCSIIVSGL